MSSAFDPNSIAMEIIGAQDNARQIEPFTNQIRGFDLSAAYNVGRIIHQARLSEGAKPVGRKIGFTNPSMWSKFGVREPIWSYMYENTVEYLKDTHTRCALDKYSEPKIEPEIVFCFRSSPRVGAQIEEIADSIEWVAHGFEIVQSHFPGWRFGAADTVADCALHGRLLIGPSQPLSALGRNLIADLKSFSLSLSCNDQLIETGVGSNVLGSPLTAIVHLVSVLASQTESPPLQRSEIVTTGTITTAQSINPGETWQSEIQGIELPGLTVEFTA